MTEHYRNIRHMTRRIQDIGCITERKKNPMDPVTNPALFFRRPDELLRTPSSFTSRMLAKPKESPIYRNITLSVTTSPQQRSISSRTESRAGKTSESEVFLNPLEYLCTPRVTATSPDPVRNLTSELLDIIREYRVYKDRDLRNLFERVREANRDVHPELVETALNQVMKTLDA
mmetsp:Transcript_27515/g.49577  ORF Transcript_27515/g.49577 Transcript_27515/m.49577 type:complete len:174 (+) Transcript_27515:294-815(+)